MPEIRQYHVDISFKNGSSRHEEIAAYDAADAVTQACVNLDEKDVLAKRVRPVQVSSWRVFAEAK